MKKILLLGDSIRLGYDRYVAAALEGQAQVFRPAENCRFAAYLLRMLVPWKADTGCGGDVDLVHWNAGLWDALLMPDGQPLTPLPLYRDYLLRIHAVLETLFPRARQVFATTTSVQEERYGYWKRRNRDIEEYNAAALEALRPLGVEIDDLWAVSRAMSPDCWSDATHFHTPEGTRHIAGQVIGCLSRLMELSPGELDYERMFARPEQVVGI